MKVRGRANEDERARARAEASPRLVGAAALLTAFAVGIFAMLLTGIDLDLDLDFGDPEPGPARRSTLQAFAAADGELVWTRRFRGRGEMAAAPAGEGQLAVRDRAGDLRMLDLTKGTDVWSVPLHDVRASRPAYADGTVVVLTRDRTLHGFDAGTGAERWTVPNAVGGEPPYRRGPDLPSDLDERDSFGVAATGDVVVAVGLRDDAVHAYVIADGAPRWVTPLPARSATIPVVASDTVLVRGGDLSVRAFGLATGVQRWAYLVEPAPESTATTAPSMTSTTVPDPASSLVWAEGLPPPVPAGSVVAVQGFAGLWTDVVGAPTGVLAWHLDFEGDANFVAYGAEADALLVSTDHALRGYDAATGVPKWNRAHPGGELLASGDVLYATRAHHLQALDLAAGVERWRVEVSTHQATPVAVGAGVVVLSS